jgi:hypothetical protein
MRFAHMDEAGNTGRRFGDPAQPVHLILSLVVEAKIPVLHQHVREAGKRHFPAFCTDPEFEFHAQQLYGSRKGRYKDLELERRIEILDDVLAGIEAAEADVVIGGVEKRGLARRYRNPYHPHDIALMFTIESIERLARRDGCQVLLVADEAREIEDGSGIQVADCASFLAARVRKIQSGLVKQGRAAEAIECLWERRVEPFIYTDEVWSPVWR